MTDKPKSDLSESLLIIHGAITRALKVAAENSELYKRQLPDRNTLDGFAMFIDCFTAILNGHHLSEDDIAFPYFKDKLPEMPFSRLMMEHQEMHGILKQIARANSQINQQIKLLREWLNCVHNLPKCSKSGILILIQRKLICAVTVSAR